MLIKHTAFPWGKWSQVSLRFVICNWFFSSNTFLLNTEIPCLTKILGCYKLSYSERKIKNYHKIVLERHNHISVRFRMTSEPQSWDISPNLRGGEANEPCPTESPRKREWQVTGRPGLQSHFCSSHMILDVVNQDRITDIVGYVTREDHLLCDHVPLTASAVPCSQQAVRKDQLCKQANQKSKVTLAKRKTVMHLLG